MLSIKANKLSTIQKEFNELFPFLKLEFFYKERSNKPAHSVIKNDLYLKPIKKESEGITFHENMAVSLLEKLFMEQFGITVHVYRKSGNSWLETTMTENWTLKQQNDAGHELRRFTR